MQAIDVAAILRGTHLFADLPDDELALLCAQSRHLTVAPGTTIVTEGEPGDAFYVVLEGRLLTTIRRPDGTSATLCEMRRGEYFGEIALLERSPRTATVQAATAARLLVLDRDVLAAFLDPRPRIRDALLTGLRARIAWSRARRARPARDQILATLRAAFPGIDEATLATVEVEVEWLALPRDTTIIRQGEPADGLYLIVSGGVAVSQEHDGELHLLGESGAGETIGEMALLSSAPRSATVETARDTELLRFSRAGFDALVRQHPQALAIFTRTVLERVGGRVRARALRSALRGRPLVAVEECDAVAATPNLVLRNLRITQMYHRLSHELTRILGHEDANWCTFACNASKTAGYSIRREEVPLHEHWSALRDSRLLGPLAGRCSDLAARTALGARVDRILDEVSAAISAGNLKVFAELAPIFARFVRALHDARAPSPATVRELCAGLAPGKTELGGQDLIADALAHYHDAMFADDPKRRAELILLGNIEIGLHEQIRLQPNIVAALNAPLEVGLGGLLADAAAGGLPQFLAGRLHGRAQQLERALVRRLLPMWRRTITETMMKMRLPYGDLRLGEDLRSQRRDRIYADTLGTVEHPTLRRLIERFDRTRARLEGSAAADWGDLDERMNFIINLFRARQKSLELFDQPFLLEQREAIAGGYIPAGTL